MSIKTKIYVFSASILFIILLIVNASIYFIYMKSQIKNEADNLLDEAELIAEKVTLSELSQPSHENPLRSYIIDDGMIRFVNKEGHVIHEVDDEKELKELKPIFSNEEKDEEIIVHGEKYLAVSYPVYSGSRFIGTLEIVKTLDDIIDSISLLLSILFWASIAALSLSILGGKILSNLLLNPVSAMTRTMKAVEESGEFKKIDPANRSKDELYKMAMTFNCMIDRLKENFEKQKQFVSDASHELKTPLTVIEGYALLLKRRGAENHEIREEAIEAIHSEAERMKEMTKQMLSLASAEGGQENMKREQIDLASFCEQIANKFKKIYNQNIIVFPSPENLTAYWNSQQLTQVLSNVLDNALKYSKKDVEIKPGKIGSRTAIQVVDQGVGIPKEDIANIFERFYRVDKSRHRKTGGTGLGLPIAKAITENHGGEIIVESEEGKGTTVTIYLD
ncbi:HAMP domain-containing protein [Bacillus aerolatus]|uniref:Signal transduction histidine-protein kinase ArlS n=1 Tax=Bacillus aerolatus TaxID=2653354 RepID=A0A6I1FDL3_9BACI|nr:ATP-binding protein [Bacillus aerolatus]KAB7705580.1 HAMP domain-containing protein [Bacillus aerolatus]